MQRPQYGLDAPDLLRFFFVAGSGTLTLLLISLLTSLVSSTLKIGLGFLFGIPAIYLLGMGCFMTYGSKVMKLKDGKKLLNLIQ
jgi:arsenite methyltransferase